MQLGSKCKRFHNNLTIYIYNIVRMQKELMILKKKYSSFLLMNSNLTEMKPKFIISNLLLWFKFHWVLLFPFWIRSVLPHLLLDCIFAWHISKACGSGTRYLVISLCQGLILDENFLFFSPYSFLKKIYKLLL
jgi:hypothetical protein